MSWLTGNSCGHIVDHTRQSQGCAVRSCHSRRVLRRVFPMGDWATSYQRQEVVVTDWPIWWLSTGVFQSLPVCSRSNSVAESRSSRSNNSQTSTETTSDCPGPHEFINCTTAGSSFTRLQRSSVVDLGCDRICRRDRHLVAGFQCRSC